ncbi:dienelactone hydrolase [Kineosphaera limosa]|uniref:Dienelactone hydrolase domain-containing protein n=1 Tax=Kineosphaera limosa NBRC 100340 TaxID=1184609 RepID=K6WNU1_9MICO|nr:dienelactone hydrolase family protein [Kineosphaera limosa]NYE01347.1 dienelactone hydrolase [Kineosphaera limosa]GAB95481.1 hypothetical protein KILIM_021_00210 [Kineosphaera limosa NBRC 100340]
MAEVVLFHHAHGLTEGVHRFADTLRQAGHTVHTPDLYDGRVFDDLAEGVEYAQSLGMATIVERGAAAVESLGPQLVFAGFSLGVVPAQHLAQNHKSATAALLLHSCLPIDAFGGAWPGSVPVQVHAMEEDPWFIDADLQAARTLVADSTDAKLFLYPGARHLFADDSLPDYDEATAGQVMRHAVGLLNAVDARQRKP